MRDPADCVKDLLVLAGGIGVFNTLTGWCISVGQWPDVPDTCILVNATGGRPPFPHLLLDQPSVQCMVRGKKSGYQEAMAKAQAIKSALLGMSSASVGGDIYRACNLTSDIAYIGQDINTRPLISLNFWFIVEPAAISGGHRVPIT